MGGSLIVNTLNSKDISVSPVATESQVIGVGQTWQDVTASRSAGVTYTNTTGKPIMVAVSTYGNNTTSTYYIDDVIVGVENTSSAYTTRTPTTLIVPNLSSYSVTTTSVIATWAELR